MKYTEEMNDRWVNQMAELVHQRTRVDISSLLQHGPARIFLNVCNKTGCLPEAIADEQTLRHIMDWMVAATVRNEPWLTRLDTEGRPLKLMKCGTIERLTHEADRAMKRWNSKPITEPSVGTEHVFDCGEGYSIFKLVTPEALDVESGVMGHCVGNGAYDSALKNGSSKSTRYGTLRVGAT
jgi:hypothetical protein